ncbi:MAG: hypothetical protein N2507_03260 [Candidatus Bipolaricaulota bacterium]|nr:hypothetical protein [Candidatus Bipolaricaulota bacterium]
MQPVWVVKYTSPQGDGTLQVWHGSQPRGVGYVYVTDIVPHERGTDIVVRFSAHGKVGQKVLHSERRGITHAHAVLVWRT